MNSNSYIQPKQFLSLPPEIHYEIFTYLSPLDQSIVDTVCQPFHFILSNPESNFFLSNSKSRRSLLGRLLQKLVDRNFRPITYSLPKSSSLRQIVFSNEGKCFISFEGTITPKVSKNIVEGRESLEQDKTIEKSEDVAALYFHPDNSTFICRTRQECKNENHIALMTSPLSSWSHEELYAIGTGGTEVYTATSAGLKQISSHDFKKELDEKYEIKSLDLPTDKQVIIVLSKETGLKEVLIVYLKHKHFLALKELAADDQKKWQPEIGRLVDNCICVIYSDQSENQKICVFSDLGILQRTIALPSKCMNPAMVLTAEDNLAIFHEDQTISIIDIKSGKITIVKDFPRKNLDSLINVVLTQDKLIRFTTKSIYIYDFKKQRHFKVEGSFEFASPLRALTKAGWASGNEISVISPGNLRSYRPVALKVINSSNRALMFEYPLPAAILRDVSNIKAVSLKVGRYGASLLLLSEKSLHLYSLKSEIFREASEESLKDAEEISEETKESMKSSLEVPKESLQTPNRAPQTLSAVDSWIAIAATLINNREYIQAAQILDYIPSSHLPKLKQFFSKEDLLLFLKHSHLESLGLALELFNILELNLEEFFKISDASSSYLLWLRIIQNERPKKYLPWEHVRQFKLSEKLDSGEKVEMRAWEEAGEHALKCISAEKYFLQNNYDQCLACLTDHPYKIFKQQMIKNMALNLARRGQHKEAMEMAEKLLEQEKNVKYALFGGIKLSKLKSIEKNFFQPHILCHFNLPNQAVSYNVLVKEIEITKPF